MSSELASAELQPAALTDVAQLMTWFEDIESARTWGGNTMEYPFTLTRFLEQMQWHTLGGYVIRSDAGTLQAFGQWYLRDGHGHVARLAVAPAMRGRGLIDDLISGLKRLSTEAEGCEAFSLYVLKNNRAAQRSYARNGFEIVDEHEDPTLGTVCLMVANH